MGSPPALKPRPLPSLLSSSSSLSLVDPLRPNPQTSILLSAEALRHFLLFVSGWKIGRWRGWTVVGCNLLQSRNVLSGKQGEIVDLLVRVVDHDGEDSSIWVARVVHKVGGAAKVDALDVGGGVSDVKEVEGEDVCTRLLTGGVLVLENLLSSEYLAKINVNELSFLDCLGRSDAEAAAFGHENLKRYGSSSLSHTVKTGFAALAAIFAFENC